MTRGVPVLDPARDLKGATPETLAKALFRRTVPLDPEARSRRKPVRRNKVAVGKPAADEQGDGAPHLDEGV